MKLLRLVLLVGVIGLNTLMWCGCGGDSRVQKPAPESSTDPATLSEMLPPPDQP